MSQNIAPDPLLVHRDAIINFNRMMDEKAALHHLNEKFLVQLLSWLEENIFVSDALYWLSLARINELAILCAANYAEGFEFALVGDLLVNPRRVLVHVKGTHQPVFKKRHTRLTDQFRHKAPSREEVVQWLKSHTIVENRIGPVLPDLLGRLKDSRIFSPVFVAAIEKRLKQLADLTAYLACQPFETQSDFEKWLQKANSKDREFIKTIRGRFDLRLYGLLGEDINRTAFDPDYVSRFLVQDKDACSLFSKSLLASQNHRMVAN